jgi:hypothetical protein
MTFNYRLDGQNKTPFKMLFLEFQNGENPSMC